jgi:microcystin-dependent protein
LTVALLESEIPAHSHACRAVGGDPGDLQAPAPNRAIARSGNGFAHVSGPPNATMAPEILAPAGGDQPHNNLQPYLTFYFCIVLQGVFPPRG